MPRPRKLRAEEVPGECRAAILYCGLASWAWRIFGGGGPCDKQVWFVDHAAEAKFPSPSIRMGIRIGGPKGQPEKVWQALKEI